MDKEKILDVHDLTKEYQMGEVVVHALRGVNMELYAGEFVVILGPSGSGKSTILNIIGGIDTPTKGKVNYKGTEIGELDEKALTKYRREAIGFVFQFYNLVPNLTARENILLASELSDEAISVDDLLKEIELEDRGNHFPSQLSGGQQQRVAIARAVAKNPAILLCDEPTGALDVTTGIGALKVLRAFNRNYKKTVAIITHNKSIGDMADRVFYVKDGVIEKVVVNEHPMNPEEVNW
ncbi:MAG: macrolide ABC transporter ATP-binding protein [Firmicutes bacterium HGW-Firmicutes-5]|nr:MAG: macrolide ABC transporter ATP-binding protein [Firmicutes bacterium HGW-Firmicutes-5]